MAPNVFNNFDPVPPACPSMISTSHHTRFHFLVVFSHLQDSKKRRLESKTVGCVFNQEKLQYGFHNKLWHVDFIPSGIYGYRVPISLPQVEGLYISGFRQPGTCKRKLNCYVGLHFPHNKHIFWLVKHVC